MVDTRRSAAAKRPAAEEDQEEEKAAPAAAAAAAGEGAGAPASAGRRPAKRGKVRAGSQPFRARRWRASVSGGSDLWWLLDCVVL